MLLGVLQAYYSAYTSMAVEAYLKALSVRMPKRMMTYALTYADVCYEVSLRHTQVRRLEQYT